MSECPVCYEEINASTGVVTLSCTHSYHFSCISAWFLKNDKSNCPCCRKEMLPIEDFVPNQEDSSEDEDDEDDEDDEGDDILFLTPQGMIDLLAAHGCYIPRTASEGSPVSYNMQQFNQICVMGGGRAMTEDEWNQAIDAQVEDSDDESVAPMPPTTHTETSLQIFYTYNSETASWERAIEESDEEMRQAAVKVQSAWREFKARQEDNIALAAMILASMDCE
jgi:hypothetical protein